MYKYEDRKWTLIPIISLLVAPKIVVLQLAFFTYTTICVLVHAVCIFILSIMIYGWQFSL